MGLVQKRYLIENVKLNTKSRLAQGYGYETYKVS